MIRRLVLTIPLFVCAFLVLYIFIPHLFADVAVESRVSVLESQMSELTWEVRGMLLALCTIAFEIVRNWISALSKKS